MKAGGKFRITFLASLELEGTFLSSGSTGVRSGTPTSQRPTIPHPIPPFKHHKSIDLGGFLRTSILRKLSYTPRACTYTRTQGRRRPTGHFPRGRETSAIKFTLARASGGRMRCEGLEKFWMPFREG